jgi:hypothetical protein
VKLIQVFNIETWNLENTKMNFSFHSNKRLFPTA